ncbi:MAG: methylated-DNA--[protein]-cysteine S-methyltransferase [Planctomycetaceae bacterium]
MFYAWYEAPFTRLQVAGTEEGLKLVLFESSKQCREPVPDDWTEAPDALAEPLGQLEAYFAGDLTTFDLKLAPVGTEFQKRVWAVLSTIPYGETWTYGQVAKKIGQPKASRAVGAANGQNPISIIVPCHRVIGSSGKLVGFGGGVPTKSALLEHERQHSGIFAG